MPLLPTPALLWRDATRLGQDCRDQGYTAGSLDLVIAAWAIHHDAELVTFDCDYETIARYSTLRVICLSLPEKGSDCEFENGDGRLRRNRPPTE